MKPLLKIYDWVDEFMITKFIGRVLGGKVEHYAAINKSSKKYIIKFFLNEGDEVPLEWDVVTKMRSSLMFCPVPDAGVMKIKGVEYRYIIVHDYSDFSIRERVVGEGKRYNWREAAEIIQQVLEITGELHTRQPAIIHNNINAQTVCPEYCSDDTIVVSITGSDYISPVGRGVLHSNARGLNMWYRAPETFQGIYNEQTDIFSIGALLYFMLMGREPWSTPTEAGSTKITKSRLKSLRNAGDEILYGLVLTNEQRYILGRMLSLDSSKRYKSVADVLSDLLNGPDEFEVRRMVNLRPKSWVESQRSEDEFDNCYDDHSGFIGHDTPNRESRSNDTDLDDLDSSLFEERKGFDIRRRAGGGFAEVAGMDDVKQMLYKEVMFVMKNREKAKKYRLKSPNGALFYGPPGCGKTYIAEKFAEESKLNFMLVKASDIGSIYIYGTQGKIAELFDKAARLSPTVICFDELDGMVPDRSTVRNEGASGEVNEFLSQLNNCADRGIFVIGTSNRPEKIDPAILRTGRLDKMVYIPLPDHAARREMFHLHLAERYCEDGIDYDELATLSEGYVASDISYIVNESALEAAMADKPISQELLKGEIRKARRSVTASDVAEYASMRTRFEQRGSQQERRRIGF